MLETDTVFVLVNAFAVASSGTMAEFTVRLVLPPRATDPPPVSPVPAVTVTAEFVSMGLVTPPLGMLRLVLPPSATGPPPVRPLPAETVSDEFASMALVTPAVAMLNVPVLVIGPPASPEPLATLVTVPVAALAQAHAVPLYCST